MPDPPNGTFTFLFTDIEGSTKLWETVPRLMADALARHDQLCRATVESHGGRLIKMIGDGVHAVFDDAAAAVAAVLELQRGMAAIAEDSSLAFRMRCGLHAGAAQERAGDYFGSSVNRAARIMGAAHGGQVLLSQAVVDQGQGRFPAGSDLLHLGRVRLRDLADPEDVWQLRHADLQPTFPALRSLDSTPNNLAQQLTSFIGREQETAEVKQMLGQTRLLTLTGSGGCGKTRLALQVAADLLDTFPDGVWLVELAALADPALVPQNVAAILGVKEERGKSLTQTLTEHLASRRSLLVLDNAEHLLAACAQLADAVLRQCPQVVVLVSSREGLGIAGELTYRVPSLSLPDARQDITPERLLPFESVRLFVDRAKSHLPQFAVTTRNALALALICSRLDGIPLAIELAAARVRSMSVEEVNKRLDQRFQLLTGGSRTALPRQQTLRSLIDWSYDLLDEAERAFFRGLAVFAGGWTLEGAEQVCNGGDFAQGHVLDVLTSLTDKNLVVAEVRSGATRYRMLETVRQYARDRLLESGEGGSWRDRHLAHCVRLAEEAEPSLTGADQRIWLERLETEHDNLRSALAWSSANGADAAAGLRLAGALCVFWEVRAYLSEGRSWLAASLAATRTLPADANRAKALNGAGIMAWQQADFAAARALHMECLAIRRELGNQGGVAGSLNNLANIACEQGDFAAARRLYEESLDIKRALRDRRGIANSLNNLGIVACEQDDYPAARVLYEEGLAIRREIGDRNGVAHSLQNLGAVACVLGDFAQARARYEEGIAIYRELGNRHGVAAALTFMGMLAKLEEDFASARELYAQGLTMRMELGDRLGIADSLEGIAFLAFTFFGPVHAARIWGRSELLREAIGAPLPPSGQPRHDREVAAARVALSDDAAFDAAWREGSAMTLEQAVEYALRAE